MPNLLGLPIFSATWWKRAGVFLLGVAFIIAGIVVLTGQSKTIQNVAKKAIDTTPQGAAIDAATTALE